MTDNDATPQTDPTPATDDESPYAAVEAELGDPGATPDSETADFWEAARGHAGLGDIAVVGGVSAAAGVAPAAWAFGDNPVIADELVALVLAGTKTATSSALADYQGEGSRLPEVGELSIILDGAGHPAALIRTTEVEIVAFGDVSADFAAAEGEDDRSLESWRSEHTSYFTRTLGVPALPADFQVVTERFELLYPTSAH